MAAAYRLEFPQPAATLLQTAYQSIIYKLERLSEILRDLKVVFAQLRFTAPESEDAVPSRLGGFRGIYGHQSTW
jgi:hypothetical protein